MLGTVANTPFDVAKSRMQFGSGKACLPTVRDIHAEGGVRALYKGLGPRLVRLGEWPRRGTAGARRRR